MKSSSRRKWCLVSVVAMLAIPSAHGQDSRGATRARQNTPSASDSPIATCTAGDYLLEVWYVDEADPQRYAHDIAFFMDIAANMGEPKTFKDKQRGPQGGSEVGGTTVTGGGGVGGGAGGSFHSPKKVLGIRVLENKSRKVVRQAVFGAGYEVLEADGTKSESTLPESFRTRYFWPKEVEPSSQRKVKLEDLIPLPIALKTSEATSLKSLKGVLVIPDEEAAQAVFSPAEIKNKARKSAGKSAVQMDAIEKKEKGLQLTLQLFLPPPPPMNPGNIQDLIKQSQLAMATRVLVHVEDTAGGIHFGAPQSGGGSGGGGFSSFSTGGTNVKTKRGTTLNNDSQPQKYQFQLSPVPEGASTKQLVCEVRRPKSAPKVIPFEFGPIDWKGH
jgi:hypothetical protein